LQTLTGQVLSFMLVFGPNDSKGRWTCCNQETTWCKKVAVFQYPL